MAGDEKVVVCDFSKLEKSVSQIANCLGYLVSHLDNIIPKNDEYTKIDNDPVLILHSMGFSKEQIASIVDLTIDATKMRLSRSGKTKRVSEKNK
jgi:hypothetical protein